MFYDARSVAIVPMGFCFPGLDAEGGDLPPRRECAPRWRQAVFDCLPELRLVIAVGLYAQAWHLGTAAHRTLTDTVQNWRDVVAMSGIPKVFPLPHPSWRNNAWIKRHPWFTAELLPELRLDVAKALSRDGAG